MRKQFVVRSSGDRKAEKIRLGVVFGGVSGEHGVSCTTAAGILKALDRSKYHVFAIGITKGGKWLHVSDDPSVWEPKGKVLAEVKEPILGRLSRKAAVQFEAKFGGLDLDVVFPLIHGPYGEDGTLQGLFEMLRVKYVGCGVLASAVGQDKHFAKTICEAAGLKVAPWVTIRLDSRVVSGKKRLPKNYRLPDDVLEKVKVFSNNWKAPIFVKPARGGSSLGVSKVTKESELMKALETALNEDVKVIIEQGIEGREIECAIVGNQKSFQTSTLGEIKVNKTNFYDYKSKYVSARAAELIVDPPMDSVNRVKLLETAEAVFRAMDCEGLSRVDMFLTPNGDVYVNEINTLPGFTNISMYPTLLQHDGLKYSELIDRLIDEALSREVGLR